VRLHVASIALVAWGCSDSGEEGGPGTTRNSGSKERAGTSSHLPLQHRQLMAQNQDLGVLRRVRTGQQRQPTDQATSDDE
jgi:hypothetical protein